MGSPLAGEFVEQFAEADAQVVLVVRTPREAIEAPGHPFIEVDAEQDLGMGVPAGRTGEVMPGVGHAVPAPTRLGRRDAKHLDALGVAAGLAGVATDLEVTALDTQSLHDALALGARQTGGGVEPEDLRLPGKPGIVDLIQLGRGPRLPGRQTAQPARGMAVGALDQHDGRRLRIENVIERGGRVRPHDCGRRRCGIRR